MLNDTLQYSICSVLFFLVSRFVLFQALSIFVWKFEKRNNKVKFIPPSVLCDIYSLVLFVSIEKGKKKIVRPSEEKTRNEAGERVSERITLVNGSFNIKAILSEFDLV